jgi:predicted dienelactone hydrolase
MQNEKNRRCRGSACASALLMGALFWASGSALAEQGEHNFYPPEGPGPYSIGHTTVVITDPARNPDGSAPASSAGRPLYLHIWYPTGVKPSGHVLYTWNNPVYSQNPGGTVYPGLPDLPALTFVGSASSHPVSEGAPLSRGKFPLLVASHGNEVAAAKNMPDTLETLASHGYIVASVEHTGNNDAFFQALFVESFIHLPLGPNPSLGSNVILQRSKDVSFTIDAMLQGAIDGQTHIPFSKAMDSDSIGVLGYSLGGETTLATVTGISAAGYAADQRVKAAFMGGGTNYGLLLNAGDYANAKVPLMFFGNDTGIAYDNFNEFTASKLKYLVDIAGVNHHVAGYQSSWCSDFRNSMLAVNPAVFPQAFINPAPLNKSDIVNYVYDSTFYFSYTGARESGIYDYCDAAAFDGISNAQLTAALFGDPSIVSVKSELQPSMPLKPQVSIAETTRLTNWYAVSFFNKTLRHSDDYDPYLSNSAANQRLNPLVRLTRNCEKVAAHPIDLQPTDKLTFTPAGEEGYEVSVVSGASLYDPGATALAVASSSSVNVSYPGFSFPVPGFAEPIGTLVVSENGVINTRTSADFPAVDDNGSPWYMKGNLLLSNQFAIGMLMKNLDVSAAGPGGGVFGYFDAANDRVIITYKNVPAAGTTDPNTLQVAIYGSGKIELIVGELANTGPSYAPGILGTIGLASGRSKASDLRHIEPISFSKLRGLGSVFLPFGNDAAIYEQFDAGTGASCGTGAEQDDSR